jgi:hypothetical protein
MTKLLQAFRWNPDAIALVVLAVMLGIGRQTVVARPGAFCDATLGIRRLSVQPIADALNDLCTRLRNLAADAPDILRLPDLRP